MKNLKIENLEIRVSKETNEYIMYWIGKSELRNPSEVINPYLLEVLSEVSGGSLNVDFKKLEFMNSSTFPALLSFMKNCESKGIKTIFQYNKNETWQVASFKPLIAISKSLKNVTIEGV